MRKILTAIQAVITAVLAAIVLFLFSHVELCIGAAITAVVHLVVSLTVNFGFRIAAENGTVNITKLNKISDTAAAEMLIFTLPLYAVPFIYENPISDLLFTVYVNAVFLILFVTILVIDRRYR